MRKDHFTPGPWVIGPGRGYDGAEENMGVYSSVGGQTICDDVQFYPQGVRHRDMPLIAAAPELLNALRRLVAVVECGDDHRKELEESVRVIAVAEQEMIGPYDEDEDI